MRLSRQLFVGQPDAIGLFTNREPLSVRLFPLVEAVDSFLDIPLYGAVLRAPVPSLALIVINAARETADFSHSSDLAFRRRALIV